MFDGRGFVGTYAVSLGEGAFVLILALAFAAPQDLKRFRELKYGRRLKGPVMNTPAEFNKRVKGGGIGFQTTETKKLMRIPLRNEAQHFQIIGDTGVGKTTLIMQMLQQIQQRGETAVVYDPAGEYVQRFYDPSRGDHILNPLDKRGPYWGPAEEMLRNAEADAIAASLYQPTAATKDEFFHETPAQIFAHLLKQGPAAPAARSLDGGRGRDREPRSGNRDGVLHRPEGWAATRRCAFVARSGGEELTPSSHPRGDRG